MSTPLASRVRELFDAALELPRAERLAHVRAAAPDDPRVAAEVMSLLDALEDAGNELEGGAAACLGGVVALGAEADAAGGDPRSCESRSHGDAAAIHPAGVRIGGYRLVRLLGSGGMGTVYEAEQDHPRRTVALKILRAWSGSASARRRFIEEAQILARLQHPGVAQVFAAGSHAVSPGTPEDAALAEVLGVGEAVPWIAMEFVGGARPITAYAAEQGLDVHRKLLLMCAVCDAVHHGHMKGVIHRDLKPANVLVDASGNVKVIDFGVARATGVPGAAGAPATMTGAGVLVGTLRYMSPEQCDGDPHALDTRSDVYSLGVILYELMADRMPYELGDGSFTGAVRAIREAAPLVPIGIRRMLGGDLERILLTALAKEKELRYQSAADLAADIRRLLADEPIRARGASWGYRARKFARRNRAVVALGAVAAVALAGGTVGMAIGFARAVRAEHASEARRIEAERSAYIANIAAADGAVAAHDGGTAMMRLMAAPENVRGWEWGYLRGLADESIRRTELPEDAAESAVSPDGHLIVVGFRTGGARGIEIGTGQVRWSLADTRNSGEVPRFSRDGRLVAVHGEGVATIVECASGRIVRRIEVPENILVLGSAFSPDGQLIALGCSSGHGLRVFRVETGEALHGHASDAWVYSPDFSPDGRWLVTSEAEAAVVRDASSGDELRRFPTGRRQYAEPSPVRVSPDGRMIALAAGLQVEVRESETGRLLRTLTGHGQRVHCLAFDTTGTRLATGAVDKAVRVWNLLDEGPARVLTGSAGQVASVAFIPDPEQPDGMVLCSSGSDSILRSWAPAGPLRAIDARGEQSSFVHGIDLDSRGRVWAVCGRVITVERLLNPVGNPQRLRAPAYWTEVRADAGLIAVHDRSAGVIVRRIESADPLWSRAIDCTPHPDCRFSPDGSLLALQAGSFDVLVLRTRDGETVSGPLPLGSQARCLAFDHDAGRLFTSSNDGTARVWSLESRREVARYTTPGYSVMCIAASPRGPLVASGGTDERVAIWDGTSGRVVHRLEGFHSTVWSVAFSPDGSRLAVGSQDRLVRIYAVESGEEMLQLRGHTGTVMRLAWSHDGRYLVSGGYDQVVRIWDGGPRR